MRGLISVNRHEIELERNMRKGFTLIELMIVIAIIAVIAAIAIPGLLAAQRSSNERNASTSLKTITTAQADFRANDRDGNRSMDFWTADVYALFGLIGITGSSTAAPADSSTATNHVRLLEPSLAGADGRSDQALYGNIEFGPAIVNGSPKAGYIFRALHNEVTGGTSTPLLNDTDGAGQFYGNCHDVDRFAFICFPSSLNSGKLLFIVNEDNTIWKYNLPSTYAATFTGTAGAAGDSVSSTTGLQAEFTLSSASGQGTFPAAPASAGCSKMD
jgi:prepilin-type N-terminal cleavage/methylation domain-containing protein